MKNAELLALIEHHKLTNAFLEEYNLKDALVNHIPQGRENASFLVQQDDAQYVLRISKPEKDVSKIRQEADVLAFLAENNIPVPCYIPNRNHELISTVTMTDHSFRAVLMARMPGENPPRYTESLLNEIGYWMAKMHRVSANYSGSIQPARSLETEYFTHHVLSIDQVKDEPIRKFFQEAKDFSWDISALPQGVIHGDIHRRNLLVEDDQISAILDFDDMVFAPYVRDIGVMIANLVFSHINTGLSLEMIDAFLNAYQRERPLSSVECRNIKNATHHRNYTLAGFFYWIGDFELQEYVQAREIIDK